RSPAPQKTMPETLRIFVSATRDLESARALIGQTLAELPVQIGAEIRRYPVEGVSFDTLFELISNVDRLYFLLGRDITAPSGAEWMLGLRLERSILPLKLNAPRTAAAQEFLRFAPIEWITFHNQRHLAQIIGIDLIDMLLHPQNRYGLSVVEMEALRLRRAQIRDGMVHTVVDPGGAEGGGVLLDREQIIEQDATIIAP
ncbi:MAG: hypothetical protein KDD84_05690, partial [Caldilineaceae bacterium]|nr:hypothetical protein [Caldilineaceae bacterium]